MPKRRVSTRARWRSSSYAKARAQVSLVRSGRVNAGMSRSMAYQGLPSSSPESSEDNLSADSPQSLTGGPGEDSDTANTSSSESTQSPAQDTDEASNGSHSPTRDTAEDTGDANTGIDSLSSTGGPSGDSDAANTSSESGSSAQDTASTSGEPHSNSQSTGSPANSEAREELEVIDLETYSLRNGNSLVVDLTKDNFCDNFVDLTSSETVNSVFRIGDNDVEITSTSQNTDNARDHEVVTLLDSPQRAHNDSVEVVSPAVLDRRKSPNKRKRGASHEPKEVEQEPTRQELSCPVCWEGESQIKKLKRQLTSTTCGHIFCDECIRSAVRIQKSCPTCRTKLTLKQLHPIYI